jgi:hypothetical protein
MKCLATAQQVLECHQKHSSDEYIPPLKVCSCCGRKYSELPPGAILTTIAGWHRVRIKTANDISGTTEIGANNHPQLAVDEAWRWMRRAVTQRKAG